MSAAVRILVLARAGDALPRAGVSRPDGLQRVHDRTLRTARFAIAEAP